jgi:hypothetical protein
MSCIFHAYKSINLSLTKINSNVSLELTQYSVAVDKRACGSLAVLGETTFIHLGLVIYLSPVYSKNTSELMQMRWNTILLFVLTSSCTYWCAGYDTLTFCIPRIRFLEHKYGNRGFNL